MFTFKNLRNVYRYGKQHSALGKNYLIYLIIFPKNKAPKVKRGLKTLRARTLGHFGQRVDESPMNEDDFGVS